MSPPRRVVSALPRLFFFLGTFLVLAMIGELATAQSVNFREVQHSDTQLPGFAPTVTANFARADGDEDVFIASGFNTSTNMDEFGIVRRLSDGTFSTLLDHNTSVPHPVFGTPTNFSFFDAIDVSQGQVYFSGRVGFDSYLYRIDSNGTPQFVNQSGTSPRSGIRNIQALDNGDIVMHGSSTSSAFDNAGFYRNSSGVNTTIANANTAVPSGTGTFDRSSFQSHEGDVGDNGAIVFHGNNGSGLSGIYTDSSGSLRKVLDTNDVMPGTSEALIGFANARISDNTTYFATATDGATNNRIGFYSVDESGNFETLVNNDTPIGNDEFLNFDTFSLTVSGDVALFGAITDNDAELATYFKAGTTFGELVRVGDLIDGREVSFVAGAQPAEDGEFYMSFRFTDNTIGRYRVSVTAVPEPSSLAGLLFATLGLQTIRRRRDQKQS